VGYVFQKAKNKPAVRVRKTSSKGTHKTMSAPGRRIPSLLRSAAVTVRVVSDVIESYIDYLLIDPPTWSPNVGHKNSPNNADLYAWAPPTALDIQQLFGAVELQIEELITVSGIETAQMTANLTNNSSCRFLTNGPASGTVVLRVVGSQLMLQS
jgi:hypothetical protein